MRVLQIATLNRPVRGDLGYAPIETIIYNIDKGLTALGHTSIVACSGDSNVVGEPFTTIPESFSMYHSEDTYSQRMQSKRHMLKAWQRAKMGDIDVIHMHDAAMTEYIYNGTLNTTIPIVMTLHVPASEEGSFRTWNDSLGAASNGFFVPISEYQKNQHAGMRNVQEVIYHGIDVLEYPYLVDSAPDEYLFSIGRITRNKGQHSAIEAARQTGMRLVLAGNVQNKPEDRAYFEELKESIDLVVPPNEHPGGPGYYESVVQPILESPKQIIYIGELNSAQKKVWFMHAKATLFPVEWGEPFGLVLVESMACGTPVIAFRRGSVPEIVSHGHTGFVVDTSQEMAQAVQGLSIIDRRDCRADAEDRFSLTVMAENYVKKYQQLLERKVYA